MYVSIPILIIGTLVLLLFQNKFTKRVRTLN